MFWGEEGEESVDKMNFLIIFEINSSQFVILYRYVYFSSLKFFNFLIYIYICTQLSKPSKDFAILIFNFIRVWNAVAKYNRRQRHV